jgi:hypothetical protein
MQDQLSEQERKTIETWRDSEGKWITEREFRALIAIIDRLAPKPSPPKSAGEREAEKIVRLDPRQNWIEVVAPDGHYWTFQKPDLEKESVEWLRSLIADAIDRHRAEVEERWAEAVKLYLDRDKAGHCSMNDLAKLLASREYPPLATKV